MTKTITKNGLMFTGTAGAYKIIHINTDKPIAPNGTCRKYYRGGKVRYKDALQFFNYLADFPFDWNEWTDTTLPAWANEAFRYVQNFNTTESK